MDVSLRPFFSAFHLATYKRGKIVVRPGEATDKLYYVKSGFIRQYIIDRAGQELTVYIYPKDSCFFLPWVFGVSANTHYFQAMTKTAIWEAPKEKFLQSLKTNIPSLFLLAGSGYMGLAVLMVHMESMVSGNSLQKVASVLAILTRWFGKKVKNVTIINFPVTHQFVASVVGLQNNAVTLAIKELKTRKILENSGRRLRVKSPDKLNEIAGISLSSIPLFPTIK